MARAILFGIPVSPGIATGIVRFMHNAPHDEEKRISPEAVAQEQEKFRIVVENVRASLSAAMQNVPEDLAEYREVIAAQIEMTRDPKLVNAILSRIEHRLVCAAWALKLTIEELCALFRDMDDPYLRDRAQDIRAVGLRLREGLTENPSRNSSGQTDILIAEDISPADVMELDLDCVQGILTEEGGPTSHTAILSRSLRIPCLAGVTGLLGIARENEQVIVDGLGGRVLLGPDQNDLDRHTERREEYTAWENFTLQTCTWPAEMCDGVRVGVQANLERATELDAVLRSGADGIGLYRTEFAHLSARLPTEEELLEEYASVATGIAPLQAVFRTLDVGADKMLHAQIALKEPNPALGLRGIRFCLRHQGIFRTQLRALMRAGASGNVAIMLPMISTLEEVQQVRAILQELHQELVAQKLPHAPRLPLGVMIETPAAALICDALARECDFFSIGTNDLIHYIMSIDRSNRHVAYLNESLHPAVLRSLKHIIDAAHRKNIGVSVCGELASDPLVLSVLLGMGVDSVSAAPRFVPGIKHLIRQFDAESCMELAYNVLLSTDAAASKRMIYEKLHQSLGPELFFHTTSLFTDSLS